MDATLKRLLLAGCVTLSVTATSAIAQTTRASCEADAKAQNIVGADRQMFMLACLPAGMSPDDTAQVAKVSETKPTKAVATAPKATKTTKMSSTKVTKAKSSKTKANKPKAKKAPVKKPIVKKLKTNKPKAATTIKKNVANTAPAKVVTKPVQ
jgi:hypothetical protein